MEIIENRIRILLRMLSDTRMSARMGNWSDSPDLAGWLLNNGKYYPFRNDSFPPGIRPGRTEFCYQDAMRNAVKCSELIYCEGYADCGPLDPPSPHGFCINKKGNVIDTVWARFKSPKKFYFGVPFKTEFVRKFLKHPGTDMSILLWKEADWPIQNKHILETEWKHDETKTEKS